MGEKKRRKKERKKRKREKGKGKEVVPDLIDYSDEEIVLSPTEA